jgi:hypothetical protein
MQRSTFHHLNRLLFWLVIWAIFVVWAAYAVGTYLEGWRTTGDVNQRIADYTNTCKLITWPKDYFVPSRTGDEWNRFAAVAGTKGFMIAECPIDWWWSGWSGYSACNASCGGGTQTRTRTCNNPTPANGGATCAGAYSESIACNTQSCITYVYNWRTTLSDDTPYDANFDVTTHSPAAKWYAAHDWCSREIVGKAWNDGNVGVNDSYCGTNTYPVGNRCSWLHYNDPEGTPHEECR